MGDRAQTVGQFKKLVLAVDKIKKDRKRIDDQFPGVTAKLGAAIKAADVEMIDVYGQALKAQITHIAQAVRDTDLAMDPLSEVKLDEEFVAERLADIEKLAEVVSSARKELPQQYQAAKRQENEAEKAYNGADRSEQMALRALARLDESVADARKSLVALAGKADPLHGRAREAVEMRDMRALAEAQKAVKALNIDVELIMFAGQEKQARELLAGADDKRYSESLRADLKDGINDLLGKLKSVSHYVDALKECNEFVAKASIEALDIKKALQALELDAKHGARLGKALAGPNTGWEKGLDLMAKELRLNKRGKDLRAALSKAGVG